MEENDKSFELNSTRCNCDLQNCLETCDRRDYCYHGICVSSGYVLVKGGTFIKLSKKSCVFYSLE